VDQRHLLTGTTTKLSSSLEVTQSSQFHRGGGPAPSLTGTTTKLSSSLEVNVVGSTAPCETGVADDELAGVAVEL